MRSAVMAAPGSWRTCRAILLAVLGGVAVSAAAAGGAGKASPRVEESELLAAGFKVLVATTEVQQKRVQSLPPGQIRPMQRNGRKYFVYPDAAGHRIYVGGPQENAAYRQLRPEGPQGTQEAANRAYRAKQDEAMRKATARDLSDPFLGVTWADLGW